MLTGFAEVEITPPNHHCLIAGYSLRPATGVHDPLMASAVYFDDGDTQAALVSFDLLAMEKELIARLKQPLIEQLHLHADHIFFFLHTYA